MSQEEMAQFVSVVEGIIVFLQHLDCGDAIMLLNQVGSFTASTSTLETALHMVRRLKLMPICENVVFMQGN